jgi:hypothetical protein
MLMAYLFTNFGSSKKQSFGVLKTKLRLRLDEETRKALVILLDVATVYRDKLTKDVAELLTFLEKLRYISEKDVSPLIEVLTPVVVKDSSLSSILRPLQKYQQKLLYPNGTD